MSRPEAAGARWLVGRRALLWLNRVLVALGAGGVTAAAFWGWAALRDLPVQHISVTGELAHTRTQAVQDRVQSSLSGGFLHADLQHMRRELESLPWIHQATVRRRWPAALDIHVTEQVAIARWGEDGYLNHAGELFLSDSAAGTAASLPLLRGPQGSAPALMARYLRLVDALSPLGLRVEELSMDGRGEVEAVLSGDIRLALGDRAFRERMQRFVAVYQRELAARAGTIARVDLRYRFGMAVAFRDPAQVAGR